MRNKILLICLFLYLWPVFKNEANAQRTSKVSSSTKTVKHRTISSGVDYLKKLKEKSFVVSCGGGCAMTYTATKIEKYGPYFKVRFNVEMYIDQVSSDTYDEDYSFFYTKSDKVDKILDEQNKNVLGQLPISAEKSFVKFGDNLIKNSGGASGNINPIGQRTSS
ncbi:hypothetical protein PBAL39_16214 [Pedobacter sp. BAL39]|uniref:hypothetical protein n=1 Tax=Pedobacter sp. BAL39 TaxID=391596 RepID=UPI00015593CB|nr:hypothetical protein [Pedobacter sp. BAL39]EDM37986.1 hypothetical protein PBAL39_16214 [Pedobacter sp. BAL39]